MIENEIAALSIIGVIAIVTILSFVGSSILTQNTLVDYLQERGAKNINVVRDWLDFDRDTKTFFVEFTHPNGNKVTTRCKIRYWSNVEDGEIFWSEPTNLKPPKAKPRQTNPSHAKYENYSEKIRSKFKKELPTYEISIVLPVPDSQDKIVMMNYIDAFRNVFRCTSDGAVVWQAELPTSSNDVYTNISWQENQLIAFSRSCFRVAIDSETGKIL